jgi:hypothetical protein
MFEGKFEHADFWCKQKTKYLSKGMNFFSNHEFITSDCEHHFSFLSNVAENVPCYFKICK